MGQKKGTEESCSGVVGHGKWKRAVASRREPVWNFWEEIEGNLLKKFGFNVMLSLSWMTRW